MESLEAGRQRIVYLITYSRADVVKFPSKESFSHAVIEAWQKIGVRVLQWVVSIEGHHNSDSANGDNTNQYHYHMAVKLAKRARWFQIRKYLDDNFGIQVNFSDCHNTYYSAYRYVTKEDNEPLHSSGHPDLSEMDVPKTESALACKKRKAKQNGNTKKGKRRRGEHLSVFDVCQIVQAKSITSRVELVHLAVVQNREGKSSLAEFIADRGKKAVDEALQLAKEFAEAESRYKRSKKSCIELMQDEMAGECTDGCEGRWVTAAEELLQRHHIPKHIFCKALFTALSKGRGKYQNVFIHGPANCGKSFILPPLKVIYDTFSNPATGSFAWIEAEQAEIIFLKKFRWDPKIIAWADLLQALEGDTVHLQAPKNVSSRDVELTKDTPFFATSDAPLALVKGGRLDSANTEMMTCRWVFFHFWKQIPQSEQQRLPPCGVCFAKFVLSNTPDNDHNN